MRKLEAEGNELGCWGKIYETMFQRSLVGSGSAVFAIWSYCIANARPPDGELELNPVLLAAIIGDDVEVIERAIKKLCSPDNKTHTSGGNGKRLEQVRPFTYRMVNWKLYRGPKSPSELRAYYARKQREYRARKRGVTVSTSPKWVHE
jgi:hypothetical protein